MFATLATLSALILCLLHASPAVWRVFHFGPRARAKAIPAALAHSRPGLVWGDRFGDGTPDFLRLTDPADQAAFRRWFTLIAEYQAIRPPAEVPPEITDCASLLALLLSRGSEAPR